MVVRGVRAVSHLDRQAAVWSGTQRGQSYEPAYGTVFLFLRPVVSGEVGVTAPRWIPAHGSRDFLGGIEFCGASDKTFHQGSRNRDGAIPVGCDYRFRPDVGYIRNDEVLSLVALQEHA